MAKKTRYTVSDGKMVLTLEPAENGWFAVSSPMDPAIHTQAKTLAGAFEMAYDAARLLKQVRAERAKGGQSNGAAPAGHNGLSPARGRQPGGRRAKA